MSAIVPHKTNVARRVSAAWLAGFVVILWTGGPCADPRAAGADSPPAKTADAQPDAHAKPSDAKARDGKTPKKGDDDSAGKFALEQQRIADRFKHLEDVLLRMAELNAGTDPRRAALLKKAVGQSKEQLIDVQFERLVELLEKDQLSRAIENQGELDQNLRALLELLLSENRAKQLQSQKKRYQEYLKRINAIIKEQKNLQGRTGGGDSTDRLSGEQGKLAEKTGGLAKDIHNSEESPGKAEKNPKAKEKGETPAAGKGAGKSEGQAEGQGQGEAENKETGKPEAKGDAQGKGEKTAEGKKKGRGEPKGKSAEKGKGEGKGEGKSKGKEQAQDRGQADGQRDDPAQGQENQDANPARRRLQAAQDRMKQAAEKLQQAQREGAVDKQEEALRELEQAKAALEEILRQLREEEIQRMLAMLEARFKKMLQMQREVYEGTIRLDKVSPPQRSQNHEIEAGRLSSKQGLIVVEADKARLLLHEDGSAVVFPEAVEQVREDMQQVVLRLAQGKVEAITQSVELDIIAALEEMIDALNKAQKDQDKKKSLPRPGQSQPQEPPLVDLLAEIRMIRAMQLRVNTRTERYSKLIDGEQAEKADLIEALRRLAERQQRIHRVTRDLELGRNQ